MKTKMTRSTAKTYIDRFINPSGLALLVAFILSLVNIYASTQLLPLFRSLDTLNTRVEILEKKVDSQGLIIIPKGEIDAKFESINTQLNDIKEAIRNK